MSTEAKEMAVCGAMIYGADFNKMLMPDLLASGFESRFCSHPKARTIADLCITRWLNEKPVDMTAVGSELGPDFDQYIEVCVEKACAPSFAASYAQEIMQAHELRVYRGLLTTELQEIKDPSVTDASRASELVMKLTSLSVRRESQTVADAGLAMIDGWMTQEARQRAIRWKWQSVNDRVGPLTDEYVVLAAQPSVGKTAFILNHLAQVAKHQCKRVDFLSLESSKAKVAQRLIAHMAKVNTIDLRYGNGSESDYDRAKEAMNELKSIPFHVTDESLTLDQIRAWAMRAKQAGSKLLAIDNLKHIRTRDFRNRFDQFAHISLQMKFIRDDVKIPIIALHHTNDDDKLAWSADIQRDADIVILLSQSESFPNSVDFSVVKNREGKTGDILLNFHKQTQTFEEPINAKGEGYGPRNV